MIAAAIGLIIVLAVMLVLVVLAQDSKSGAMSSNFGATQLMGVKRTGDILEKLTWGFMIAIMVISVSSHFLLGTGTTSAEAPRSANVQKAMEFSQPAAPKQNTAAPAAQGTQPATAPAATDSSQK